MDRNIPHVLDIFASSPGETRRSRLMSSKEPQEFSRKLKEQKKNPGSDSAVCLCTSSDEDERNISKYFEYLEEETEMRETSMKINDQIIKEIEVNRANNCTEHRIKTSPHKNPSSGRNKKQAPDDEIKYIERHLSMKKTIRKKMMRDLQQAFVEDPKEFQQDLHCVLPDRKNNINIKNLTITKKKMSKSDHSFLEMLKENEHKDQKRSSKGSSKAKISGDISKGQTQSESDSGNESPTRDSSERITTSLDSKISSPRALTSNGCKTLSTVSTTISTKVSSDSTKSQVLNSIKEEKKSLWHRIMGKGKSKR